MGYAAGVHHLAVDHHAGRAHHAVTHDLAQLFDLGQRHRHALVLGHLLDQRDGVLAVGTTGAEYLDVHVNLLKGSGSEGAYSRSSSR
jgi:hypothetical protein